MHYLTIDNAKTTKGESEGYLTGILYLAPHTLAGGPNVCPHATAACKASCLYSAGRGAFSNVQEARIRKTKEFFRDRAEFVDRLADDIVSLIRMAKAQGLKPAVRLNGTSDLPWEKFGGKVERKNLMGRFPSVQFYDYTKNPDRASLFARGGISLNYHLTFSLSETNRDKAIALLEDGCNVAAVFATGRNQELPLEFLGRPVIDGDRSDLRFLEQGWQGQRGNIVGLRAKGQAKHDRGGFVLPGDEDPTPMVMTA